jgi:hypothetical protein
MTTIATNHEEIAADTQVMYWGALPGKTDKISTLPDGSIIACAGDTLCEYRALQFFSNPQWPTQEPIDFSDKSFEALLWYNHKLYACLGSTVPNLIKDRYFTIGSGGAYARSALELGMNPKDAIKFASKFDANTNNKVHVVKLT